MFHRITVVGHVLTGDRRSLTSAASGRTLFRHLCTVRLVVAQFLQRRASVGLFVNAKLHLRAVEMFIVVLVDFRHAYHVSAFRKTARDWTNCSIPLIRTQQLVTP